jgi:hypothetical protein
LFIFGIYRLPVEDNNEALAKRIAKELQAEYIRIIEPSARIDGRARIPDAGVSEATKRASEKVCICFDKRRCNERQFRITG